MLLSAMLSPGCNSVGGAPDQVQKETFPSAQNSSLKAVGGENPCLQFNQLNSSIRDGAIDPKVARTKVAELLPKLGAYFYDNGGVDSPANEWVFPLEGYGPKAIGGKAGSGYVAKGYNYFDGNKHGGHPAHDLFIFDRNQDEIDDRTGQPVKVLSMRNGVVVATENQWAAGSELRGGKYLYIFDAASDSLLYYAHNREVFVKPGEVVTAGQVLATVGRSGKNAYLSRSPTHLHLMWLVFEDGMPVPKDIYPKLLRAIPSR